MRSSRGSSSSSSRGGCSRYTRGVNACATLRGHEASFMGLGVGLSMEWFLLTNPGSGAVKQYRHSLVPSCLPPDLSSVRLDKTTRFVHNIRRQQLYRSMLCTMHLTRYYGTTAIKMRNSVKNFMPALIMSMSKHMCGRSHARFACIFCHLACSFCAIFVEGPEEAALLDSIVLCHQVPHMFDCNSADKLPWSCGENPSLSKGYNLLGDGLGDAHTADNCSVAPPSPAAVPCAQAERCRSRHEK